jgi:hypothetical protein
MVVSVATCTCTPVERHMSKKNKTTTFFTRNTTRRLNTSFPPAARQSYAMHRTKGEVSCDAWRLAVRLWR